MKRTMLVTGLLVVAVLVGMLASVGAVSAQGPTSTPAQGTAYGPCGMGGGRWGGMTGNLVSVLADLLGTTSDEVIADLQAGKTVLDLISENGLTTTQVVDAWIAPRIERMQAAVDAGRMTQEQVDLMVETMRENMTTQIESGAAGGVTCPLVGGTGNAGGRGGMMGGRGGMMGGRGVNARGAQTL